MTSSKRTRGRPKGTGIDDSERLIAMALEMAAHPGTRPTTAIKALGITEQSTIRRLRDKYRRACQNGTLNDIVSRKTRAKANERLQPANDDVRAETTSTAALQHYALALQSSVVAIQHRISANTDRSGDDALHEMLDQQYHLSNVLLGLITETRIQPSHTPPTYTQ